MAMPLEEPLLKVHYDNCPGCIQELKNERTKGIPYREFFFVWFITLANVLPLASLFPYLYFMIRDLKIAKRVEDIGFYAGFVGASYMLGRALTSTLWGIIADRHGRKAVMIIGTISVIIFNTLFGLSVNYWMAIVTRFFMGAFNGLLSPIKAYSMEICNKEHQALGISLINSRSCNWRLSFTEKYPNIFSSQPFFLWFPYFLPSFCVTLIAVAALISNIWLLETLHIHEIDEKLESMESSMETESIKIGKTEASPPKQNLLTNWPLMIAILLYCICCLVEMGFTEIFSLWSESNKRFCGLSFSSEECGQVLLISGSGLLLFQLFVYPRLDKIVGPVVLSRICAALSVPLVFGFSYMTYLSGVGILIVVTSATQVKNILVVTIRTRYLYYKTMLCLKTKEELRTDWQ